MIGNPRLLILGVCIAVAGLALLLIGLLTWNKQLMATGLIAFPIAATVLYYAWRAKPATPPEIPPEKK